MTIDSTGGSLRQRDCLLYEPSDTCLWKLLEGAANAFECIIWSQPTSEDFAIDDHAWVEVVAVISPFLSKLLVNFVVIFLRISSDVGVVNTLINYISIDTKGTQSWSGAFLRYSISANLVNKLHIREIKVNLSINCKMAKLFLLLNEAWASGWQSLVKEQAILYQMLLKNISTIPISLRVMLHCTVLAIWNTVLFLVVWVTVRTWPCHELWLEAHSLNDRHNILGNIANEVKRSIITCWIPQDCLDRTSCHLWTYEVSSEVGCLPLLVISCQEMLLEQLSLFLVDQHWWDPDTCTSSIVWEHDFTHVLPFWVNDQGQGTSSPLNVSNLGYKGALVWWLNQEYWSEIFIRVASEIIGEVLVLDTPGWVWLVVVKASKLMRK